MVVLLDTRQTLADGGHTSPRRLTLKGPGVGEAGSDGEKDALAPGGGVDRDAGRLRYMITDDL